MRCLLCEEDGLPPSTQVCPKCNIHLPSLLWKTLPPGTLLHDGTYHIDYALSSGGFGIIYRAMHTALDTPVAIKEFYPEKLVNPRKTAASFLVSPRNDKEFQKELQSFLHEGKVIAEINHPGIVRVRDLFRENATAYLVMDLVRGATLRKELRSHEHGLPRKQVENILEQLVAALTVLHQAGIYHLDIKPENVLLTTTGQVVLVDFGAARQTSGSYSIPQFDPSYTPPEVMSGQFGPQSDLFELGMLACELLTGKPPPSVEDRLTGTPLQLARLGSWHESVTQAIQIQQEKRPASVAKWWQKSPTGVAKRQQEGMVGSHILSRRSVLKGALMLTSAFVVAGGGTLLFEALQAPQVGVPLYIYTSRAGSLNAVAWSADGTLIAAGSADHLVNIWDASSGDPTLTCKGHTGAVYTVAWSTQGEQIASAGEDGMVKIWHTNAQHALLTYTGHKGFVYAVAWSANDERIASAGAGHVVNLWKPATGHTYLTYKGHKAAVRTLTWSPQGNRIASGGEDHLVKIWAVSSGHTYFTCKGHTNTVYSMAWSPDDNRLATGGGDATLRIWDTASGQPLLLKEGHTGAVYATAWSPDGNYIATGSEDKTIIIWDTSSGDALFTYTGHSSQVKSVAWSPDSKFIVSSSADGTAQIWRAAN